MANFRFAKKNKWKAQALTGFFAALDLLFPPVCGGCGKTGTRWCADCQDKVQPVRDPVCDVCGLPVTHNGLCSRCAQERPAYTALRSWAVFEKPVQTALHRLKYRRDRGLGEALAAQMAPFVSGLRWPFDAVIPIPLGKTRLRERGYNQVAMLAMPLSSLLDVDYFPGALARARETRSQVGLTAEQRQENVQDAFLASARVRGRTLLLVDDVSTTGATLSSAADALYACGADGVFAVTIARALPHHSLSVV
ncbi:MAG: ComF family protein [Chloroflexota bacterium]